VSRPSERRRVSKARLEEDVGRRLRAHREQRQLSLRELARRLGISPSAISQIETGKAQPSVGTLYAMVSELGMSLDELFSGTRRERPVAASPLPQRTVRSQSAPPASSPEELHVQRQRSRKAIDVETGVRWERLTPQADPETDFLYLVYDVGGSSCKDGRFIRHSGREYGLVLSGTLEVTVGFDRYELGPGDSVWFDSTMPHCLRALGTEPAHAVWFVVGREAEHAFGDGAKP
jgi:transcriptional regulator with XRE-family HTH domain